LGLQMRRGAAGAGEGERLGSAGGALAGLGREVALVGRSAHRAELVEAVEAALGGAGGLGLVVGEAGQGKSRLLREVARGAEWRGAQVSWGGGRADAQALR